MENIFNNNEKRKLNRFVIALLVFCGITVISALIGFLFAGSAMFQSFKYFISRTYYGVAVGCFFWWGNAALGYITGNIINWKKNIKRANFIALLSFIIFGIAGSIIVPFVFGKYVWNHTGDNLRNNVLINGFINLSIDMILFSIFYTSYLVKYWKQAVENAEELKRENLTAKYEALRSQLDPHFLFNSLNTLTGVVEQDQPKAVNYIKHLSDTYRYVLEQRDKELVTVEQELKFVEDFFYIAKLRYGKGLKYQISVSSFQKMIAPLGLQTLIENCIKHNVIEDDLPLNIEIFEEEEYLVVRNNFQKKNIIAKQERIGLNNLRSRYAYLTSHEVRIQQNEKSFIVKVPLIEKS